MMEGGRGARPYRTARFDEALKKQQHEEEMVEPEDAIKAHSGASTDEQEPFMGMKVRRRSSMFRLFKGDYIDAENNDQIRKLLTKQGDRQVLYAENVVKVTRKGKVARRILLITDMALYILDTQFYTMKRRVPLASIGKLCLSECSDNFFAVVVPSEYDTLFASARKTEIVTVLVDAFKKLSSQGETLTVEFSNKFEYYLDSEHVREVVTETVEGGVKTSFVDK
ncbi:hypothetical protein MPTK1_5g11990 [Marchantia polymorpha subsp. ruderalis]|nr:hypothetical protein MARPO_0143s0028 [Marchantia polymorpha]PTQ29349.1 hypothetical protein MARPO_0143s0028 [Marchantia polymorpha]BBN11449.1 hypothetical protein Mp_5g11990 [Marchantia polymorpha subsp. ruderalis]BBN11450.1 hypothetical protein Mp_5g11990 [Marchantia polymorpha subsp. ruderalis]|eukprot:PTQ29348.1 hypothetical protein MARPO_0143s0028 [Marchantia polymorpha]